MSEKKGTPATRAKNKFNAKTYDRLYPTVKKGKKDLYVKAANKLNISLNEYIETTLDKKTAEVLDKA